MPEPNHIICKSIELKHCSIVTNTLYEGGDWFQHVIIVLFSVLMNVYILISHDCIYIVVCRGTLVLEDLNILWVTRDHWVEVNITICLDNWLSHVWYHNIILSNGHLSPIWKYTTCKNMECLEITMETLVFEILICWTLLARDPKCAGHTLSVWAAVQWLLCIAPAAF